MSSFCGEGCEDKKNDKANVLVEIAKHGQQLLAALTDGGVAPASATLPPTWLPFEGQSVWQNSLNKGDLPLPHLRTSQEKGLLCGDVCIGTGQLH